MIAGGSSDVMKDSRKPVPQTAVFYTGRDVLRIFFNLVDGVFVLRIMQIDFCYFE